MEVGRLARPAIPAGQSARSVRSDCQAGLRCPHDEFVGARANSVTVLKAAVQPIIAIHGYLRFVGDPSDGRFPISVQQKKVNWAELRVTQYHVAIGIRANQKYGL